jgi:hypothetical protein
VRGEWAQQAVAASQALAPLDLAVSVWVHLVGLVARIPPPEGPSERTLAGLVVSRAGWEILQQQAERGLKTHHQVVDDWTRLLALVETGPWCEMVERLVAADGAAAPASIAVRARAILNSHREDNLNIPQGQFIEYKIVPGADPHDPEQRRINFNRPDQPFLPAQKAVRIRADGLTMGTVDDGTASAGNPLDREEAFRTPRRK